MKEWLAKLKAAKTLPWLLVLLCCAAAMLFLNPSGLKEDGMTAEEARISRTLSRISGAGETRLSVHYASEASSFAGVGSQTPIGAVIVSRGAKDLQVRLQLLRAAQTLLGLSPGQVEVFAMEETP